MSGVSDEVFMFEHNFCLPGWTTTDAADEEESAVFIRAWQNSCLACLLFCSRRRGGTHTNRHVCFQLLFLLTERWRRRREREKRGRDCQDCWDASSFYTLSFPNNIWSCVIDAVLIYSLLFYAAVGTALLFLLVFYFIFSPLTDETKTFDIISTTLWTAIL